MVFVLLSMTCLLGVVAFAVDIGVLLRAKRVMQIAADSGAIAGAAELKYGDVTAAAGAAAAQNGITTVTVNNPPVNGPYAGNANYVEVIAYQDQSTFFMNMFNRSSMTVSARAVATLGSSGTCAYTLGTSGADFDNIGVASITLTNCGMLDNSASGNAFSNSIGALIFSANSIGIVGGRSSGLGVESFPSASPVTGIAAVSDPLAYLTEPSIASCGAALIFAAETTTVSPGCYDGLTITGAANLTFTPGLYVFNGPISLTGAANLSGTGVTFFFNNSLLLTGLATMNLSAPTSGTWNGILFFESRTDSLPVALTGAAASILQGIIYMPNASLDLTGIGLMHLYTPFVVSQLRNTGVIVLTLNNYASVNPSSPLTSARLVE